MHYRQSTSTGFSTYHRQSGSENACEFAFSVNSLTGPGRASYRNPIFLELQARMRCLSRRTLRAICKLRLLDGREPPSGPLILLDN
jgi:hypothetical protein